MNRQSLATLVAAALAIGALVWARTRDRPIGGTAGGAAAIGGGAAAAASSPALEPAKVGGGAAASRAPATSAEEPGDQPQAVVWKMVDASKARDVTSYLDCFGGDLRTRLDGSVREMGENGFADYLARRVEELKGVALYDVDRPPGGGAAVTIEYVFATEKEMQRLHLEQGRGGWRITAADASKREKSLIPYGTPIEQVE